MEENKLVHLNDNNEDQQNNIANLKNNIKDTTEKGTQCDESIKFVNQKGYIGFEKDYSRGNTETDDFSVREYSSADEASSVISTKDEISGEDKKSREKGHFRKSKSKRQRGVLAGKKKRENILDDSSDDNEDNSSKHSCNKKLFMDEVKVTLAQAKERAENDNKEYLTDVDHPCPECVAFLQGKQKNKIASKKNEKMKKASEQQMSVVDWMKKNVPTKKTRFMDNKFARFFISSKALDALMKDSPWAPSNVKEGCEFRFEYREQASEYLGELLKLNIFHRAKKIPIEESNVQRKHVNESTSKEKTKRKIRLEMHLEQLFIDSGDAYIWIDEDPIPWHYYMAGATIILGLTSACLFPLWPEDMRQGVYYLFAIWIGILMLMYILAFFKYVIFLIVLIGSKGKVRLWIFPNLSKDVGFARSFWPVYTYHLASPDDKKNEISHD